MPRPYLWKYSLFNCFTGFESPLICLQGWFCPCWLYGDNNHVFRQEGCCGPCCCGFFCCPCLLPINAGRLRTEIRHKYNIRRGPIPDWMVHTFCCSCGWCQEAKELQGRPVGQYIPPSELQQSKAKQEKQKGGELSAPDTQVIASGRLVSASEAGTAQPYTGAEEAEEDRAAASQAAGHSHAVNGQAQVQAGGGSKGHLLTDAGFSTMPRKLATIMSGEPVVGTPHADEAQDAQAQSRDG
ncbi:hypothetical protein ABBQ38_003686 [Trebouxia sp. C0009 RCD-2024]